MCCCCWFVVGSGVKQVKVESAAEQQDELVPFESTVEDFSEMGMCVSKHENADCFLRCFLFICD